MNACRTFDVLSVGAAAEGLVDTLTVRGCGSAVGRIVGEFRRGCYVRCSQVLFAIGDVPPGPLHVVVRDWPASKSNVAEVVLSPTRITIAQISYELECAPRWQPRLPPPASSAAVGASLRALPDEFPLELNVGWMAMVAAIESGELLEVVRVLQGRGSGLTPSGDDALAGLLLVDAQSRPNGAALEERRAIAESAATTELSRGFLRWAACGQSIEPVHRLFDVAASGNAAAVRAAAARVRTIGASSGGALLAGVRLGVNSPIRS